jgi:hypothetical protein
MTFATPLLAAIAAAIAIPALLILYFLKLRRRDLEVSSTLLWKKTVQDMQANAPFQKLRRNLLLFLQMLALLAGLFALAQPELDAASLTGARHTIIIDRSASMATLDGVWRGQAVSRLQQAQREALALIEGLRTPTWLDGLMGNTQADRAGVIAFDAAGEILQVMTEDPALLRAAIERISVTDAPTTDAAGAYRLAIAQAPPRTILDRDGTEIELPPAVGAVHLWSDGRIADAAEVTPGPEDTVVFHRVGSEATANIGITGLRAERSIADPRQLSVFVGLSSTASVPRTVDVHLSIDGSLASVRPASLAPASATALGTGGVVFTLDRPEGSTARVAVVFPAGDTDPLPADDTGWLVIPPAKRLAVAVVAEDDFFTSLALEGLALGEFTRLTPDEYLARRDAGTLEAFDVTVLDGWLPPGSLGPGAFLVLGGVPDGLGLVALPPGGTDEIIDWDARNPVMRDLALGGRVVIAAAPRIEIERGAAVAVLAQAAAGPVIADASSGSTRAIVVAFDPDESSWPFDVSYVVFLAAAVESLGGAGGTDALDSFQPGGTLTQRLPVGARDVRLRTPGGETASLTPAPDGRIAFGPIRAAGVYTIEWSGPASALDTVDGPRARRAAAVNLLDAAETDVRAASTLVFASGTIEASQARADLAPRALWRWPLIAFLVLLLIEWWVYNRRVYL